METKSSLSNLENALQTLKTHPASHVYVRASYDYVSQHQNDLTFNKGDLIRISRLGSGWYSGWYQGSLRGSTGWVPGRYCELISDDKKSLLEATLFLQRPNSSLNRKIEGNESGVYVE